MSPNRLSYYNLAIGGLRGATNAGLEPTYYWDSFDSEVQDWVADQTAPRDKIRFSATSPENLSLLRQWEILEREPVSNVHEDYNWYILQNRPSVFDAADRHLFAKEVPAFRKTIRAPDAGFGPWNLDVPILLIYTSAQRSAAVAATARIPCAATVR